MACNIYFHFFALKETLSHDQSDITFNDKTKENHDSGSSMCPRFGALSRNRAELYLGDNSQVTLTDIAAL